MKKVILRTILGIVCLIPTLMAILLYNNTQKTNFQTAEVSAVILEGPGGSSTQFHAKNKAEKEFISFLLQMNNNAEPIEQLPSKTNTKHPYKATFVTNGVRSVYYYYFSTVSPSSSYMMDSQKQVYQLDAVDTIAFLDGKYSADLYPASAIPTLCVANETLSPSSAQWTYYTYSGTGHTLSMKESDIPTYTVSYTGITLSSSRIPDDSLLVITDNTDRVLYKGSLSDYDAATTLKKQIRKDTLLHFSLSANWKEQEGGKYSGKVSFSFDVKTIFDPAAHFWLGETSVEQGEFVVLSGEFVEEITDLSFSSSPSIGYKPTFVRDGEYVRALIPISRDLASGTGLYTFTITCQSKTYPLQLSVTAPTHSEAIKTYNYSQKVNTALRNESNLAEFRNLMASLPVTPKLYSTDRFTLNTGEGTRAKYGQIIHNTGRESDQFRSNGLAFVAYGDTKITPAGAGTVVAVTTTAYGGNTVVVDHGWGMFSVYYCLGSLGEKAVVGTYVSTTDTIGYGGREGSGVGYTDGITCYCEVWIGGQPVSYYPLESEGILIGSPS